MKLTFLAKIESKIKIKTNLKMQKYNNPDTNVFLLEEEDPPDEMIGVRRCWSGPGLFRLSPDC